MFSKKTCGLPSGRPSFIKISLRFARAVEDACPYRFGGFLNVMPVGEGLAPPDFINLNLNLFQQVILSERSESNFWEGER